MSLRMLTCWCIMPHSVKLMWNTSNVTGKSRIQSTPIPRFKDPSCHVGRREKLEFLPSQHHGLNSNKASTSEIVKNFCEPFPILHYLTKFVEEKYLGSRGRTERYIPLAHSRRGRLMFTGWNSIWTFLLLLPTASHVKDILFSNYSAFECA